MIFRVTTPSVDSGNPSASNNSPTRQENGHAINIEHAENFEADMALITQKIDTLRKLPIRLEIASRKMALKRTTWMFAS